MIIIEGKYMFESQIFTPFSSQLGPCHPILHSQNPFTHAPLTLEQLEQWPVNKVYHASFIYYWHLDEPPTYRHRMEKKVSSPKLQSFQTLEQCCCFFRIASCIDIIWTQAENISRSIPTCCKVDCILIVKRRCLGYKISTFFTVFPCPAMHTLARSVQTSSLTKAAVGALWNRNTKKIMRCLSLYIAVSSYLYWGDW